MNEIERAIIKIDKRISEIRNLKDSGTHFQGPGDADNYINGLVEAANIFMKELTEVHFT